MALPGCLASWEGHVTHIDQKPSSVRQGGWEGLTELSQHLCLHGLLQCSVCTRRSQDPLPAPRIWDGECVGGSSSEVG